MHQTRPLPDTHPELTVFHWEGFTEYRVGNWRLARDGSGRVVSGTSVVSWVDAGVWSLVLAALYVVQAHDPVVLLCAGITVACLVWSRVTQVLHESVLVFPTLGIQLETHRGHPLLPPIFVTRHLVPLSALEDVVIHEGIRRWNVRFYLALLQRRRDAGNVEVHVAFENVLPYFPVLNHVYLGVHEGARTPRTSARGG